MSESQGDDVQPLTDEDRAFIAGIPDPFKGMTRICVEQVRRAYLMGFRAGSDVIKNEYTPTFLDGAFIEIADAVALNRGWASLSLEGDEGDGEMFPWPSVDDAVRALREPFPLAAAFMEVCRGMGVDPGPIVKRAAEGIEPIDMRAIYGDKKEMDPCA